MRIHIGKDEAVSSLKSAVHAIAQHDDVQSVLVLGCDSNAWDPMQVEPIFRTVQQPLFGGIFPALIHGAQKMEKGFIVAGMPFGARVSTVEGLSLPDKDFDVIIDALLPDTDTCRTMLVFVDGFAKSIGAFIESLFNTFGLEMNYIGGGAGSLSMVSKPCLFTRQGFFQDSALLVRFDIDSGIGVSHGWQSISGPYKVTEAEQNRIITLDWEPAFDVYRQAVESHSGREFIDEHFFELAGAYPFGIAKMGAERVVRDPIMKDDQGGLTCVGEVPEGAFVDILNGDSASLIQAAGAALAQAQLRFPSARVAGATLFIDCISRVLFLKDRFHQELEAVQVQGRPTFGVCSLGEIANSGSDYLEFYNKTSVIGILEES